MVKKNIKGLILALGMSYASFAMAACPSNQCDPYEPFNRVMFKFNDFFDCFILKPVANFYNQVTPKPVAKGITNFFNNIDTIPTILNDLLQLNFYQAVSDTWRFGINTTIGVAGFVDVASCMGLKPNAQDFGLTLAKWGYCQSNYLILPFFGPGTFRDDLGFILNYYYLSIYPYIEPPNARYLTYGFGVVVRRADLLRYETLLEEVSFDKYVFMRDAYLQHRNFLIEQNCNGAKNNCLPDDLVSEKGTEKEITAGQGEVKVEQETKPISDI